MAEWPNVVTRTLSQWLNSNPFIPKGIRCIVSDEGRVKIGTGVRFNDTPYLSQESILRKTHRKENARYFLPNFNEIHKAYRYDPSLNAGAGGYWRYGTKSNDLPGLAVINEFGVGQMTDDDNTANWGEATNWSTQRALSDVGTNGAPSHYGVYDVDGNSFTIAENSGGNISPPDGGPNPGQFALCGGSSLTSQIAYDQNYSSHYIMPYTPFAYKTASYGIRVASLVNPDNFPGFVDVGDAGNPADTNGLGNMKWDGYGAVSYEYKIRATHVTHAEYCEYLNATAAADDYDAYGATWFAGGGDEGPGSGTYGGIKRHGKPGSYYYTVMEHWQNKPAGYANWAANARYCNWLHNGKPSGPQIAATTEDGAYTLNGNVTTSVARNSA